MLTLIVAVAENQVIGSDNRLIWHLSEDLKRFKALTMGHPIIMGRNTYESIGKPLAGRQNIVLSRAQFDAPNCFVVNSLDAAIAKAQQLSETAFVIGGESIYQQALPLCSAIELTLIHHTFEGDAFFPKPTETDWEEVQREDFARGKDFPYPFSFIRYERRPL